MPRACCICLVVMAFLLTTTNGDNDRPIISYWSRGVCPPELQAFLHPANKPPALPTLWGDDAVLRSSAEAGCRAGFTIPVWEWPEPARHGASAPCLGAAWGSLQGDYWVQIPGTVHLPFRSCWVSKSAAGRIPSSTSDCHGVAQAWPCPACQGTATCTRSGTQALNQRDLVNQPPLHTHPALGRRLDWDDPGVRAPVICRTGVPGGSAQGTVYRSRSGIPGRFR